MLVCTVQTCLENMVGCLGSIAMIAVLIPWFLLSVPPFVLILFYLQRRYVVVSRELKRLDGVSRSPMYAHFSQTLQVCLPCVSFCKRQNFYFHSYTHMYENLLLCTNSCDSAPSILSACKLHIRSTQYLFTLMQSLEHLNAVRSS